MITLACVSATAVGTSSTIVICRLPVAVLPRLSVTRYVNVSPVATSLAPLLALGVVVYGFVSVYVYVPSALIWI